MTRSNGDLAFTDRNGRDWVDWRRRQPSPRPRQLESATTAVARAHWIDGVLGEMTRRINKQHGGKSFPKATDPIPEAMSGNCLHQSWKGLAWPEPEEPVLLCVLPAKHDGEHDTTTRSAWCWQPVDGTYCTRPVDHPNGAHRALPFVYT